MRTVDSKFYFFLLFAVFVRSATAADFFVYDDDAAKQLREIDHGEEAPEAAYQGLNNGIRINQHIFQSFV
jgi:hypothetical protein